MKCEECNNKATVEIRFGYYASGTQQTANLCKECLRKMCSNENFNACILAGTGYYSLKPLCT